MSSKKERSICKNKKAYFDYEIYDTWEWWIELVWCEVRAIRLWQVNLKGSYIFIRENECFVCGMHIGCIWQGKKWGKHDPQRERKILLHRKTIIYLAMKQKEEWFTCVPLELYWVGSLIKVKVGLVKWRKLYEKKQVLKEKSIQREAQREIKEILSRY